MNTKRFLCAAVVLAVLISVCGCSPSENERNGGAPLYLYYEDSHLHTIDENLPLKIDISVSSPDGLTELTGYDDPDTVYRIARAFRKTGTSSETEKPDGGTTVKLDMYWADTMINVVFYNDSIAEVSRNGELHYYLLTDSSEFFAVIHGITDDHSKATGFTTLINDNGIKAEVANSGSFNAYGDYVVTLHVENSTDEVIGLVLADYRVNGINEGLSDTMYVAPGSSSDFIAAIPTDGVETVISVSFRAEIYGEYDGEYPILESGIYSVTPQ